MQGQSPPLSRILCAHADDGQPMHWLEPGETCGRRLDGSQHDEQHCYLCGTSSRTEHLHPIVWKARGGPAETRWACADLGPCVERAAAAVTP